VRVIEGTDDFFEAVWMHKYKDKYYLSYGASCNFGNQPRERFWL
jgi:hypothetical protein